MKENAAWALGVVGKQSAALAAAAADAGALPLLLLALQEPEISLKQVKLLVVQRAYHVGTYLQIMLGKVKFKGGLKLLWGCY